MCLRHSISACDPRVRICILRYSYIGVFILSLSYRFILIYTHVYMHTSIHMSIYTDILYTCAHKHDRMNKCK